MQTETQTEHELQAEAPNQPREAEGNTPDCDFTIEIGGGPMDGGGQVQTGNPPP